MRDPPIPPELLFRSPDLGYFLSSDISQPPCPDYLDVIHDGDGLMSTARVKSPIPPVIFDRDCRKDPDYSTFPVEKVVVQTPN
jgi:hypothetical protein